MGDGGAPRAVGPAPLGILMDPLVIERRIGKGVNTRLVYFQPRGNKEFFANRIFKGLEIHVIRLIMLAIFAPMARV